MMARPVRLLTAALIALGTIGISASHPTYAAGGKVGNCLFTTLQTDLQAGGDWYYTAGECTTPIIFTSTIVLAGRTSTASLTAQGHDITLDGGHTPTVAGVGLFHVTQGHTFGLTGLTLSHGFAAGGGAILNGGTLTITNSTLSDNGATYNNSGGAIANFSGAPVTITNSTLSGNYTTNPHYGGGGAIAGGNLTITNSALSGNSAGVGGAIWGAKATITNSTLSSNSATASNGGAIFGGQVTITNSILSANAAVSGGGAIWNQGGPDTITSSTLSSNSATQGGAIYAANGPLTITNSTLFGNSASSKGGAIYSNSSPETITSSTLSGNSGPVGGAIYKVFTLVPVNIVGSIIASSTGGNCGGPGGTPTDTGYNLEWSGTGHTDTCGFRGTGDITGTDPQLGSLADNGGPTHTIALHAGSPAIDKIPITTTPVCLATDQRGAARPDTGEASCDIGAYESGGTVGPPTGPSTTARLSGLGLGCGSAYDGPVTVALAVTDSAGSVTNTLYRVDTGADRTYSGPFVVSGSGSHTVTYHSIDNKGNVEPAETTTFQIAAPSITALPAGGTYKAVVSLSGSNFVANERVTIYWDRTGTQPIASVTASPSCSLVTSLKVPQAILGKHIIIAVGGTSGRSSSTPFQVQALAFILEPSGNLGAEDGLYGVGFGAGESIVAHWNSSTGPVLGAGKTNGVGSFSPIKFRVPTAPPGTYKVYAVGQGTHATAFATFAFVPSLSISSAYGAVGQTVTIRGTSYGANENVALVWDCASAGCKSATTLGTAVADSTGAFHISVRIPTDADVGTTYAIGAKGRTTGTFGTVSYTVTP